LRKNPLAIFQADFQIVCSRRFGEECDKVDRMLCSQCNAIDVGLRVVSRAQKRYHTKGVGEVPGLLQ